MHFQLRADSEARSNGDPAGDADAALQTDKLFRRMMPLCIVVGTASMVFMALIIQWLNPPPR